MILDRVRFVSATRSSQQIQSCFATLDDSVVFEMRLGRLVDVNTVNLTLDDLGDGALGVVAKSLDWWGGNSNTDTNAVAAVRRGGNLDPFDVTLTEDGERHATRVKLRWLLVVSRRNDFDGFGDDDIFEVNSRQDFDTAVGFAVVDCVVERTEISFAATTRRDEVGLHSGMRTPRRLGHLIEVSSLLVICKMALFGFCCGRTASRRCWTLSFCWRF